MSLIPQTVVALSPVDIDGDENVIAGASFSVAKRAGGAAVIYYDSTGFSPITQPTTTDGDGEVKFFIEPGQYVYTLASKTYPVDVVGSSFDEITINEGGSISGGNGTSLNMYAGSFNNVSTESINGLLYLIVNVSGISEDLIYASNGNAFAIHRFTNAAEKTYTVRPNADHAVTVGAAFNLRNVGAGLLTIVAGSGVTINPPSGGTLIVAEGGTVTLICVAEDEYDLIGQAVSA